MTHHRRVAIWLLRPPTPDVLVHPIRRREPGTLRGCRLALSVPCGKSILSTSLVQVIYAHSLRLNFGIQAKWLVSTPGEAKITTVTAMVAIKSTVVSRAEQNYTRAAAYR